ncbi:SprT-like domain-containing protein [Georgenia sp. SYP-B2076]|uniref:SprT-like domain-containing protein n=1 Tax=Georgenia sp. SYP-B2076 TaxID=2495881 RepID=UPI00197A8005|nr:SprT-like domain-containing protein [Georgenia sp. SYP-B2076]
MDLTEVRRMGQELLAEHGLRAWQLAFDNAKRRAGACKFDARTISVSRHLMALYDEDQVRDTLLHEIAHALVGPRHAHDAVWRAKALAIGCSGSRLVAADAPRASAPWHGTCPRGHSYDRHRRPSRVSSCARCDPGFNPDFLLTWTFRGRPAPMGTRYDRELRTILSGRERRRLAEIYAGAREVGGATLFDDEAALLEDEPAVHQPALWWQRELDDEAAAAPAEDDEGWMLDEDGRRWRVEEPPVEIADPPLSPLLRLELAAANGQLTPGWRVRITAPGKYLGLEGTIVKSARTRYHVRSGPDVLTVPFELVQPVRPAG